jgi:rod shape-determining protein MreC
MAVSRRSARPRSTLLVLILGSLTLITLDVRGGGLISGIRGDARDAFAPVQSAASSATRPVTNLFHGMFQYQQLKSDNTRLRSQLTQLRAEQIQAQYFEETNKDLSALLKLSFVGDIPYVTARVIAGPESNFQLTIVIDRGTAAGILKGMPVVAGEGLVGRVMEASASQSTVLLASDASESVGVQFAPGAVDGVATGQGSGRPLQVTLIDPNTTVPTGAVAVTSGEEGSPYPRGIPVGTVASSLPDVGVQAHQVSLATVVDLGRLSYVDVLVWTPQTPGAGSDTGGVSGAGAPTTTTAPAPSTTRAAP